VEIDPPDGQTASSSGVVLPPGFAVRKKDGALACAGCHQPHGSANPTLWIRDQETFCVLCHRL
jgi:predicted CXXCH cytochrome family protein